MAALVAAFVVVLFSAETHAANCQENAYNNRFDGFYSNPDSGDGPYGVKGDVDIRQTNLCNGSDGSSASSAWVMIHGGGGYDYAQVGYLRTGSHSQAHFTEWSRSMSEWDRTWQGGVQNGTSPNYEVKYSDSDNDLKMFKNDVQLEHTPFNPLNVWGNPWNAQFFGETVDRGDDVPGTPATKVVFAELRTKHCKTCEYNNPDHTNQVSQLDAYKFDWVNFPTKMRIWTDR